MIWSRYNEFIKQEDGSCFLFNCRTKKWLRLVSELYDQLTKCHKEPDIISKIHPELFNALVENKFIVANNELETSECIAEIENKLESTKILKLTINPTLDCNLRCWYCYEGHLKGSIMQPSTIDAICKYLNNTLEKYSYEKLQLAFFGGEPLLRFDAVVKPLITKAKQICNKLNVELAISFTTNGVCLTPRVREEIKNVTSNVGVQIPFDGDSELHDCVKKFATGKGSYEIVKNNAKGAVIDGFRVTIRCNFTKKNIRSFKRLIQDFEELHSYPNLRFSFHKVWQEPEDDELKEGIKTLKKNVSSFSFNSNIHSYFGDSVNPCYGDYAHNYVINYNGDVFKCTARDFHTENRIGIITETGEIAFNDKALQRVRDSYTSECYVCRRLPICPICSQVRSEAHDGKCPVKITQQEISVNIKQYFFDLHAQFQQIN
ncbi:radical SAM protein [Muribaculaceae bacterium Isolate-113 (HZI)]|uniref:radical SAM protein n=1 Tax=Bacteroides acidifaciens TaxID=85831 RepID=UPI000F4A362B|nr:radical SAM protein [Bacteroides acidifaciens]ROT17879.1 radical SAM protein [Muribaculaceae bacterium Isolate-114 (HZI)]ROT18816.1 radical SAM protein [Muribaculaceae bacterium Isolate-113 (HZI)]